MPTRPYHGFVAVCAVCGQTPELGNDFSPIFTSMKDLREMLQDTDGDTTEEKVAGSCYGLKTEIPFFNCGDYYHHRRCLVKPCGYCRAKGGGWLDALRKAARPVYKRSKSAYWFFVLWWWDIANESRRREAMKKKRERLREEAKEGA